MKNDYQGDIELIWQENHDKLLGYIVSKVKNKEVAEDILQNVFVKILSKLGTLKDHTKLKSWLYQITSNSIIDHFREKIKQVQLETELNEESDDTNGNLNEIVASWLTSTIEELPTKYREALTLSEINGISQKEMAKQLGMSYAGAKSRVQRGRVLLKDKLNQCCCYCADKYGNIISYQRREDCR